MNMQQRRVGFTRAERLAQIRELKAQGLTSRQIGERLGMSRAGVSNILNDPDGSKQRARRKRYQGQCVDCGYPTDGSNGYGTSSARCVYCAQGRERPAATRPRLCVPLVLSDVPIGTRLSAVHQAVRFFGCDEDEALELLLVAYHPADEKVHWVSESARAQVEAWQHLRLLEAA